MPYIPFLITAANFHTLKGNFPSSLPPMTSWKYHWNGLSGRMMTPRNTMGNSWRAVLWREISESPPPPVLYLLNRIQPVGLWHREAAFDILWPLSEKHVASSYVSSKRSHQAFTLLSPWGKKSEKNLENTAAKSHFMRFMQIQPNTLQTLSSMS